MSRRQAREFAVQTLYQMDMRGISAREALEFIYEENKKNLELESDAAFLEHLIDGITRRQTEIDAVIAKYLRGWTFERLSLVERAVLRIAVYEILFEEDIPVKVSVNEAVELARSFGMEDSVKFINGILSNVVKEHAAPKEEVLDKHV